MTLRHETSGIQASNPVRLEDGSIVWEVGGKVHTIRLENLGAAAELPQVDLNDSQAEENET